MKETKPYKILSEIYSHLMKDINYDAWAKYLLDVIEAHSVMPQSALELASGAGDLAKSLYELSGMNIILSDLSWEILTRAKVNFPKIVCDMRNLPFHKKFDIVFSTFDSVNYLLTEDDLLKLFTEVKNVLFDDGIFLFDVSLENNSLNNAGFFNYSGKINDINFERKSYYNTETKIHVNEFVIKRNGNEFYEKHEQRIFPLFDYFSVLEKAGLFAAACYDAFTFDDATPESERAQFVVRKIV